MRVLIVDDHPIVTSGFRAIRGGSRVDILEAADAESGERTFVTSSLMSAFSISICRAYQGLNWRDGFSPCGSARIIMFSMNDDPIFAVRAIEAGAKGYVSKSGDPSGPCGAIREVGKRRDISASAIARNIAFAGPRSPRARWRN